MLFVCPTCAARYTVTPIPRECFQLICVCGNRAVLQRESRRPVWDNYERKTSRSIAQNAALDADTTLDDLAREAATQSIATKDGRWTDVALGALALRKHVRALMADADREARS